MKHQTDASLLTVVLGYHEGLCKRHRPPGTKATDINLISNIYLSLYPICIHTEPTTHLPAIEFSRTMPHHSTTTKTTQIVHPHNHLTTTTNPPLPTKFPKKRAHPPITGITKSHAMTPSERNIAIKEAIDKEQAIPNSAPIKKSIGKTMQSNHYTHSHPFKETLDNWSEHGCPVDCGQDWTRDHLLAALRCGPHVSATHPDAIRALQQETEEKLANGYARMVRWGDIKDHTPPQLKLSPVAMIPHKSRKFRTILDLSFRLRHRNKLLPSVNSNTALLAPAEAMIQLGQCIHRIIATMADNYNPDQPFLFSKLDIKDGFWRVAVSDESAWNFCYAMPNSSSNKDDLDNIQIIVPNSLQMGWCESPPFFCAVTETARDVMEHLLLQEKLPHHKFEDIMMNKTENTTRLVAAASCVNLLEVFVDDFMAITNNEQPYHLQHFSRAMLHGIHSVFPPPEISGHPGEDPISQKKLAQGDGTWEHTKEILGWMLNGLTYTIQLPQPKCAVITKQIKAILRMTACPLNTFQKLAGKLQHVSLAILGGRGLFSPIHNAMHGNPTFIRLTPILISTFKDWRTLVQDLANNPTPILLLVADYPNFIQYTDACGIGAGGVICAGTEAIANVVWQFEWPQLIKDMLVTQSNRDGKLSINDLELAGMVLGWLVLEYVAPCLEYKHIGSFCDNTSAVSWASKGHTSKSIPAARLLRFLTLRQRTRRTSSLLPISIPGEENDMADISSRAFKDGKFFKANNNLIPYFNSHFPLPQKTSWREFKIPTKLSSRVISCLLGEQLQMESLVRLPKLGTNTGLIGAPMPPNAAQTHTSTEKPSSPKPSSLPDTLQGSGQALSVAELKSKFRASRKRLRPSPRPWRWLDNRVPSTKRRMNTSYHSRDASKASGERTLPPSRNSQSPSQYQRKHTTLATAPTTNTCKHKETSP